MEDVMNASISGGVMIGSSADLVAQPWIAILIGFCSGIISTLCFNKVWFWLNEKFGIHDTCGVNNLHGIPGIIGGIIGAIACSLATKNVYGSDYNKLFVEANNGRSASHQAWYQIACLGSTIAIALLSGLLTGCI